MAIRLVALDDGPDIPIDREMLIVGRHPQCDARLDSIRVSRRHCCMSQDQGEVVVRDLGSTNGIRINGQRIEMGRLKVGDELSIAHIRFRLDNGQGQEPTVAEPLGAHEHAVLTGSRSGLNVRRAGAAEPAPGPPHVPRNLDSNPLAAAVRELLPPNVADRCRIQVIVEMDQDAREELDRLEDLEPSPDPGSDSDPPPSTGNVEIMPSSSSSEQAEECPPDSSL